MTSILKFVFSSWHCWGDFVKKDEMAEISNTHTLQDMHTESLEETTWKPECKNFSEI
jgi:hypothetical protein